MQGLPRLSHSPHARSGPVGSVGLRPRRLPHPGVARRAAPGSAAPAPCACPVCGGAELRVDEVADRELLRLAACLRCDHRWTERLTPAPAAAAVASRRAPGAEPSGPSEVRPAA